MQIIPRCYHHNVVETCDILPQDLALGLKWKKANKKQIDAGPLRENT